MSTRDVPWFRIAALVVVAAVIAAVILIVRGGTPVPDDVQPIDWNHQACAHCQMLIGDPHHAAQLITDEGDVRSFDDPGCALRYVEDHHPAIHRLWFHHATEDRWLSADEVAFTTGGITPMGSGLLAVERGAPRAIDLAAARAIATAPSAPQALGPDASPREDMR